MNDRAETAATTESGRATDRTRLFRRTIRVLLVSQLLAGAGLSAGIVVGALLAEDMLGARGSTGLPTALFTLGAALTALIVGRVSQAFGRRVGLAGGFAVAAVGGVGVVVAAAVDNVPLLLASLFIYGSGSSTNLQARYAGADLAAPDQRGRAISYVLVATTAGAVAGPNLTGITGDFAESVGIRALAGPFMLATVAFALAAVAVFVLMRPDPLLMSRRFDADDELAERSAPIASRLDPTSSVDASRMIAMAAAVMVITQTVMIAIMTMTPIHMRDHHHSLNATGLVISLHIAAMFLPSPLTGIAVDRYGRRPMVIASGVVLLAAALLAALAPPESMLLLTIALMLLGLGWNFGLLAGTAMLTDALPPARRAIVQGRVDLMMSLAGAAGGLGSGFVVAGASFAALSYIGGALALVMLPLLVVSARGQPAAA